jgi:hypothetical protein
MALKPKWVNDPDKYEKLSKPFDNRQEAEKAIKAFMAAVSKLREKHKIADVVVAIKGSFLTQDKIVEYMYHTQNGHILNGLPLSTFLYDKMKEQHNNIIDQLKVGAKLFHNETTT